MELLFLILLGFFSHAIGQDSPVVEIENGLVQGNTVETHYGINVNSFYGIPFAAPPVGELRFAEPAPPASWEDVFNATSLGTACMQSVVSLWFTHPGFLNVGEDCLNLNVFTPENMNPDTPYPVMIYFYGGAYVSGSNIMYPGHYLATRDVVVVVPNYRVGVFGWANTDDEVAPGNWGLYDQNMALHWIQSNIAAFGGDPDSVTLFGQSAGGSSAGLHIVSPKSAGLFHRTIQQSGSDLTFWALNLPNSDPADYTRQTAAKVDCPTDDTAEMFACLREVPPWVLRNNSGITCTPGHFCQGHAPVVDGPGGFVPDYPGNLREAGDYNQDVCSISGYCTEDGALYTLAFIPAAGEGGFTRDEFQYYLWHNLVAIWEPQFEDEEAHAAYQAVDYNYTPWPELEDKEANRQAFNDMITDAAFGYLTDKQLLYQSTNDGCGENGNNYKYLFGFRTNNTLDGSSPLWNGTEWSGVFHAADIPYVIGWALMPFDDNVRIDAGFTAVDVVGYNEEDKEYTDFWMDTFTNFVKYGNPTPEPLDAPLGNGPMSWDAFDLDSMSNIYMRREIFNRVNYRVKDNAFIWDYVSYILGKPLFMDTTAYKPATPKPNRKGLKGGLVQDIVEEFTIKYLQEYFPGQFDDMLENLEEFQLGLDETGN